MADDKTKADCGGETQAVEFNLSDPEQLAHQLQRVDLTEAESDELLREAYKVNKHLRMMLKQKQDKVAASLRSQSADSVTLPPIHSKGSAVPQRSLKAYGHAPAKSGGGGASAGKSHSKSGKSKSPAQRPGWDDRFSYS